MLKKKIKKVLKCTSKHLIRSTNKQQKKHNKFDKILTLFFPPLLMIRLSDWLVKNLQYLLLLMIGKKNTHTRKSNFKSFYFIIGVEEMKKKKYWNKHLNKKLFSLILLKKRHLLITLRIISIFFVRNKVISQCPSLGFYRVYCLKND